LAYGSGYSSQATSSALFSSPLSHKPTREKAVAQVDTNQTKSLSAGIIFRVDPDNYKFYSNYLGADGSYSMPGTNGSHLHKCIFTNASSQMHLHKCKNLEAILNCRTH
jgi:hypothetical protein